MAKSHYSESLSDAEIELRTITHWLADEPACRSIADLRSRDFRVSKTLWIMTLTINKIMALHQDSLL